LGNPNIWAASVTRELSRASGSENALANTLGKHVDKQRLLMPRETILIAPAQLVHQMVEVGGWLQGFRPQALLQPLADGLADRAAGSVINRLGDLVDSIGHCSFPLGRFRFLVSGQVAGLKLVSRTALAAGIFSKKGMNGRNIVPPEIATLAGTKMPRPFFGRGAHVWNRVDAISSSG
jgi:hypothetical protein